MPLQFHLRDFRMKVCQVRKLFLTETLDELVHGDQGAPASQHEQVTCIVLWSFAYDCIITNDFAKEHWLPTVLISVHSDVRVQPSELHKDRNHMRIYA